MVVSYHVVAGNINSGLVEKQLVREPSLQHQTFLVLTLRSSQEEASASPPKHEMCVKTHCHIHLIFYPSWYAFLSQINFLTLGNPRGELWETPHGLLIPHNTLTWCDYSWFTVQHDSHKGADPLLSQYLGHLFKFNVY